MSIKAIVSDFDGTLIDKTQILSDIVAKKIQEFVQSGFIFSIATGRAYQGIIETTCKKIGLKTLVIVRGGSEIIDTENSSIKWAKYIDQSVVPEVLKHLANQKNIFFAAERGEFIYSKNGERDPEFGPGAEFKNVSEMKYDQVPKIVIPPIHSQEMIEEQHQHLIEKFSNLHIAKTTSHKGMGIDINDGGAGKKIALYEYAKLMNISPKEILGIGDSYNDYPLLSACGYKVAVGNANEELKELADVIVSTQSENGIIEAINLVLNNNLHTD